MTSVVPASATLRAFAVVAALGAACLCHGQLTVDNSDPAFSILSGSWSVGDYGEPWGTNYHWTMSTATGADVRTLEWRPTIVSAGWYDVQIYYVDGTNRASNVPFTVHHADGDTTVLVDQRSNGETWLSLGEYYFEAGTNGSVEMSNDASATVVIADAVRFQGQAAPIEEFRGFWADVYSVGFKSPAQVDDLINRALQGNYNAILPEVLAFHDNASGGHGAYWDSNIVPKAPDISGGYDPLADLVQQAHAVGIEVHPWLVPFRVSSSWPPTGNTTIANNPEWLMVEWGDMGLGPRKIGSHYILDPGCPAVQQYLLDIAAEIINNYDIDGIHWDYIRYTDPDAGYPAYTWYGDSGLERFRRISGFVGTPDPDHTAWSDFRRREITEFVRRANVLVATSDHPRQPLRHTAALITWGNPPNHFDDTSSWAHYQNWEYWLAEGYLDAGIPMTYFREWEYPTWYRNWVDSSIAWSYSRHLFTGQATYLNSFADSNTQIAYAQSAGAEGIVTYSYEGTYSGGTDWAWYPYVGGAAFADEAVPPTMPWRDPATATAGAIYGRAVDGVTAEPIDNGTVRINGFDVGRTDGNGFYVLTELPVNASGALVSISIESPGYALAERPNVLLERAGFTEANIGLGSWLPGDYDVNGTVDFADLEQLAPALTGPALGPPPAGGDVFDVDLDVDVDLLDLSVIQLGVGL